MKKLFFTLFFLPLLGIGIVKAQVTATANVHVKLTDVLSLSVVSPEVNINFNTAADYQAGVSTAMSGHLLVTSNKPYTLNVKAAGNLAGTGANTDVLAPSILTVQLPTGGNNTGLGVTPSTVAGLTTSNLPLLTAANPAVAKALDVTYSVPSSVSTTTAILGKTADTYTTVVTYTLTQ